jgi:hypothetical protein
VSDWRVVLGQRPVIAQADAVSRRRMLVVYAGCVLLALVLFIVAQQWGLPLLVDYLRRSGEDGTRRLRVIGLAWMLIPLIACFYMFRLGRRMQRSADLVPGRSVIDDTPVPRRMRKFGTAVIISSFVIGLMVIGLAIRFAKLTGGS